MQKENYKLKKGGFGEPLRSDFVKIIEQSNVNGFFWNKFLKFLNVQEIKFYERHFLEVPKKKHLSL